MKKTLLRVALAAAFFGGTPAVANSFAYATLGEDRAITVGASGDAIAGALYESGSIGKFACTLATLRLADSGALDLGDSLGDLLPGFGDTPIGDVTLKQVLASRSGLADGLLPAFRKSPADVMSTPDARTALMKFATGELVSVPGTQWSYDLVNWIAVQAVVEQTTGQPIGDVLDRTVLQAAGMGQSRIFIGEIGDGAAPPSAPVRPLPGFLTCAGGLATTPTDLIALARFPHQGGLSAESLELLTSVTTEDEGYTLGGRYLAAGQSPSRMISWQTGSNGAYKSLVTYDPHTDTAFAAMTASDDNSAIQQARSEWMAQRGL
ncbi:serine hydrolase domain-containing protein [Parerythrobacter jejuensis]|uniref:Serine hydrolase n=1 Tax=Parerythrobacter jejuensis TaxID=795812 RepID=A0A845AKC6_9SPHN|nr:serine hydrolase domain-containing protein [Parerythrobacter jejuensis]MXP31202.1 serine hydrolase [Parerythrobacter jejuensis]MXP33962.1 serine hydrolase [Parerythrobacter jejuensis]